LRRSEAGYGGYMLGSGPRTDVATFTVDELHMDGGTVVPALHGDADLHVAGDLDDRLSEVIDDGAPAVVMDLSSTTFLDSMALGVLLSAMKRLRARGGRFRVVVPPTDIRRIFEVTLLDRVFDLDGTREEALDAAAQGAGP
jgi:anti-sigma B factor antagonist